MLVRLIKFFESMMKCKDSVTMWSCFTKVTEILVTVMQAQVPEDHDDFKEYKFTIVCHFESLESFNQLQTWIILTYCSLLIWSVWVKIIDNTFNDTRLVHSLRKTTRRP